MLGRGKSSYSVGSKQRVLRMTECPPRAERSRDELWIQRRVGHWKRTQDCLDYIKLLQELERLEKCFGFKAAERR